MNTVQIVEKAKTSSFYRWLMNFGLRRMIPFNKPHGFKVLEISDHSIKTFIPYRRVNFNHIRGIHACALATLSEFTTGFLLISRIDPKKYRIIMPKMEMDYHYQAKTDVYCSFEMTDQWLMKNLYEPLKTNDAITVKCEVKTFDKQDNHLTTGIIHWHVKPWDKVKTKLK